MFKVILQCHKKTSCVQEPGRKKEVEYETLPLVLSVLWVLLYHSGPEIKNNHRLKSDKLHIITTSVCIFSAETFNQAESTHSCSLLAV